MLADCTSVFVDVHLGCLVSLVGPDGRSAEQWVHDGALPHFFAEIEAMI